MNSVSFAVLALGIKAAKERVVRKEIYVLSHGSQWKVQCDDCKQEVIFNTQADAIARARSHVAELPEGTLAQIRVQGENAQFRIEWTYGKDPFPPIG